MLILQGMQPNRVDWRAIKVPEGSFGHMIGNSMSVNVLERLLPRVLLASGLLEGKPVDWWQAHCQDVQRLKGRFGIGPTKVLPC